MQNFHLIKLGGFSYKKICPSRLDNKFQLNLSFLAFFAKTNLIFPLFSSINTVYYMAPFATMILAVPAVLLEGNGVTNWFYTYDSVFSSLFIIFSSGVLAFCLNFSIFYVIHSTTAVTFNVAGNLKVSSFSRLGLQKCHNKI